MLDKISTVIGLVQNGIELGKIYSSSGAPVSPGNGIAPESKLSASIDYWSRETTTLDGRSVEQRLRIESDGQNLQRLNDMLREYFDKDNVPIPKADEKLIIPMPRQG